MSIVLGFDWMVLVYLCSELI